MITITMQNGKQIKLELYPEAAPITVQNFVEYILEKTVNYNRSAALEEKGSNVAICNQHREIYDALVAGDSCTAVKKMSDHLDYVQNLS